MINNLQNLYFFIISLQFFVCSSMQTSTQLHDIKIPKISIKNKIKGRCKITLQTQQKPLTNNALANYEQQNYLKPKQQFSNCQFQRSITNPEDVSFVRYRQRSFRSIKHQFRSHSSFKSDLKELDQMELITDIISKQNNKSNTKLQRFLRLQMSNNSILQTVENIKNRKRSISNAKTLRTKTSPDYYHKNSRLLTLNRDSFLKGTPLFPQQYKKNKLKINYSRNKSDVIENEPVKNGPKLLINVIKARQNQKFRNQTAGKTREQFTKCVDPKPSYQVLVYKSSTNRVKCSSIGFQQ